jgi:hypothetical protein
MFPVGHLSCVLSLLPTIGGLIEPSLLALASQSGKGVGGSFRMTDRWHVRGSSSTRARHDYVAAGSEQISAPFSFMHISIIVCSDQ